jgi:hypothetical protein
MQSQELQTGLGEINFSAVCLVPEVPDLPIGVGFHRELGCAIERELALGGGPVVQRKINGLRDMGLHGHDSVCPGFPHVDGVVRPLAIFRPSDI